MMIVLMGVEVKIRVVRGVHHAEVERIVQQKAQSQVGRVASVVRDTIPVRELLHVVGAHQGLTMRIMVLAIAQCAKKDIIILLVVQVTRMLAGFVLQVLTEIGKECNFVITVLLERIIQIQEVQI